MTQELPSKKSSNESGSWESVFSLRKLFEVTTLVGISLATLPILSVASQVLLGLYLATLYFGDRRTRLAGGIILALMYLPYLWLIWDISDFPWDSYRRGWIANVLQLPGYLAAMPFHPLPQGLFDVVTSLATLVAFCTFLFTAKMGRWALALVSPIVLGLSVLNSCICLAIYRF